MSTRRLSSFCAPRCDIPSKSATSELLTDSIPSMCESAFRSDAERLSELFPPLSELLAWLSELLGVPPGISLLESAESRRKTPISECACASASAAPATRSEGTFSCRSTRLTQKNAANGYGSSPSWKARMAAM